MSLQLFLGDTFFVEQEVRKRRTAFAQKYPQGSVSTWDVYTDSVDDVMGSLLGGGLFATKTLVTIYNLPCGSDKKTVADTWMDKIRPILETTDDSIVVMCVSDPKPDKRLSIYKKMLQTATVHEKKGLTTKELPGFINQHYGASLPPSITQQIIDRVGDNPYHLQHEAQKLSHYAHYTGQSITADEIAMITIPHFAHSPFAINDMIQTKPNDAIRTIEELLEQGESIFAILGLMIWGAKTIIMIIHAHRAGYTSSNDLKEYLGIHPFVIKKILDKRAMYDSSLTYRTHFFLELVSIDYGLKTGKYTDKTAPSIIYYAIYHLFVTHNISAVQTKKHATQ